MAIAAIKGAGELGAPRLTGLAAPALGRPSFAETLTSALADVNQLQAARDRTVREMVAGQVSEVHDVMVAAEEAQLAFELLLEVRNRLLESYQEIMRLQV